MTELEDEVLELGAETILRMDMLIEHIKKTRERGEKFTKEEVKMMNDSEVLIGMNAQLSLKMSQMVSVLSGKPMVIDPLKVV